MGLITKNAIEQLIVKIKSEMTTKSDITQLRTMLGVESEARKAADKVKAYSIFDLQSEVVGQEIKWTAKFSMTSVPGVALPYLLTRQLYAGQLGIEIIELNSPKTVDDMINGVTFRTPLGVSVTKATCWIFVE